MKETREVNERCENAMKEMQELRERGTRNK
jgi:hypothetical protein